MGALPRMTKFLTCLWAACIIIQSVTSIDYCKRKCPLFDPISHTVHLPGPTKEHFYKCNFGVGVLFRCNRGTHFNPKKQVCDWPRRARAVACKGSPDNMGEGSGDDGMGIVYH